MLYQDLNRLKNIEEEEPRKFEIEIIDSLSKYSDKELDEAIKGLTMISF